MRQTLHTAGLLLATVSLLTINIPSADASGYRLRNYGGEQAGAALAGKSAPDAISGAVHNPAALGRATGVDGVLSLGYLGIQSDAIDARATTAAGTPAGGGDSRDAAPNAVIPGLVIAGELDDNVVLGISVSTPWGLRTEHGWDWAGRYHADETELVSLNVQPQVTWRASDQLHLGAGLQVQQVDGTFSNAIDVGSVGAAFGIPGAMPGMQDAHARLQGDDWGVGFTLGAAYRPFDGTTLGLSYRSKIDHELSGTADFTADGSGLTTAIRNATGQLQDTGFTADLTTPEVIGFGLRQEIGYGVTLLGEVEWTRWSRLDELRADFANPPQGDDVTFKNWEDTWFVAAGAEWAVDREWTLRGGVAYDQSPVPTETRNPRIPDTDRTWLGLGAGWQPMSWIHIDIAYAHVWMADGNISLDASQPGNAQRGSLDANVENCFDVVSVTLRIEF